MIFDRSIFRLSDPQLAYEEPARHRELDGSGQPTNAIVPRRRASARASPIPEAKKVRGKAMEQADLLADDGKEYNPTEVKLPPTLVDSVADWI